MRGRRCSGRLGDCSSDSSEPVRPESRASVCMMAKVLWAISRFTLRAFFSERVAAVGMAASSLKRELREWMEAFRSTHGRGDCSSNAPSPPSLNSLCSLPFAM